MALFLFIGCQNTPAKGFRYCEDHKDLAREFLNDESPVAVAETGNGLLIVSIVNEKILRQESVYEVHCINQPFHCIVIDWTQTNRNNLTQYQFSVN